MRYYSEATVNGIIHDMYQGNHIPKATDYPSIEIPESPWHTSTPTEEGWYIVAYKPYNRDDIGFGYDVFQFNGGCWYDSNGNWTDPFMVAWQKIEPFKESE